jgi:hypothetical protein
VVCSAQIEIPQTKPDVFLRVFESLWWVFVDDYSKNATLCTPAISKRFLQRMFLHMSKSSLRTM